MAQDVERKASCLCGQLSIAARGEPNSVYLCSCHACQKKSGSAFTYAAIFPENAVTVFGEWKVWRYFGEAGRWIENRFCPACGTPVYFYSEGLPGMTGISVGCFNDSDFAQPARLYWASRHHRWLLFPEGVERQETQ